ncbi:MAG: aldo/keto reductase [Bacteroidaceae bacterium]|jgi:predicted aldo/keto reductase-like oxidoreductase|nr:aldo/keto reductase [Bacteroidaceae bacterium]
MDKTENNGLDRRGFLKTLGAGIAASASLYGCSSEKKTAYGDPAVSDKAIGEMTYRESLTGDKVSLLGYGCMRWPMTKDENGKDIVDQERVNELVDYAIEHGVNYFDTAPVYLQGQSEKATGIALKRHPRDKFFIATKLSNFSNSSFENSKKMYEQSFKEMQVDYIDYYLLHSIGGGGVPSFRQRFVDNGIIDFLVKEREAGRIRNLGWSYHGDKETFLYVLDMDVKWDFVQIQMNYADWKTNDAEFLYRELEKRNIPVVIMEPLLGGRLAKLSDHLVGRLKQRRPDLSVASWAFRFAGHFPRVLTSLSGMTYKEHLIDNLKTYSPIEYLTDEELEFLEETAQLMLKYPTIPCNDCKYCMPCPYGIDIPAVLLHYNKCVNEGNVPKDRQDPKYREARQAFLVGYDRSVPKLRQASHCIGCNQCMQHCPQRINIPRQLHRIDEFVEKLKQDTL